MIRSYVDIASDPTTPPEALEQLWYQRPELHLILATNPSYPVESLINLTYLQGDAIFVHKIMSNPSLPVAALCRLVCHPDLTIASAAIKSPRVPLEDLVVLMKYVQFPWLVKAFEERLEQEGVLGVLGE